MKSILQKIWKVLLVSILLTGVFQYASAQMFWGFKAGYLSSKLAGDTYGGINWQSNVTGGFSTGVKLMTDFNLHFDILYSVKGTNQKFVHKDIISGYETQTEPFTRTVTKQYDNNLMLSYIEVPIYLKKSFSFKGGIFPYQRTISKIDLDIFAGAYGAFMFAAGTDMSAKRSFIKVVGQTTTTGEEIDTISSFFIGQEQTFGIHPALEDTVGLNYLVMKQNLPSISNDLSVSQLNRIDAGILAGLGFSVELNSSSKLTIDARYSIGLLSIDNTYFNNVYYSFAKDIDNNPIILKTTNTKINLTNQNLAFYIGFIQYLGVND